MFFFFAVVGIRIYGKKVEEIPSNEKTHDTITGTTYYNADTFGVLPVYIKALFDELSAPDPDDLKSYTVVRKKIEDYCHAGIFWVESWLKNAEEADKIDINKLYNEIEKR